MLHLYFLKKNLILLILIMFQTICVPEALLAQGEQKLFEFHPQDDLIDQPKDLQSSEDNSQPIVLTPPIPGDLPNVVENNNLSVSSYEYTIGVDDILDISVLKPDQIQLVVTVSLDGHISFPYIGSIKAKDLTLGQIQAEIQNRLADGYMKYPIVSVILKESRSRKFFVYGEVNKPGTFPLEENTTVLRAISVAGGFTRFGSSSRVKVLRPKKGEPGYTLVKVNITDVMEGNSQEDLVLQTGDIVVVSEGIF